MFTVEEVLAAGYRKYPHGKGSEFCLGLYQKGVRDNAGNKRYFINLYLWRFPDGHSSWAAEVRLYRSSEESFDLNLLINKHTLTEVESFYQMAYERMGCILDAHNNDEEEGKPPPTRFERI